MADLTIGQIAHQVQLAPSTLRYYESLGLWELPQRVNGQRRYSPEIIQRIRFIQAAQAAGFTLREIRDILDGWNWRSLLQQKIAETDASIREAQVRKKQLEAAAACLCANPETCPTFQSR